jgi:hypothetical protein
MSIDTSYTALTAVHSCPIPDTTHHAVAHLTGPCRMLKSRHLPQGCQISGQRDGGFSGTAQERHHRPQPRQHVLHSLF